MNARSERGWALAAVFALMLACAILVAKDAFSASISSVTITAAHNAPGEDINGSVSGVSADTTDILYDWRANGTSIAVLNMNFDVNNSAGTNKTKDYSTFSNNGTVINATWNATGGWNGTGAYSFAKNSSYIYMKDSLSLEPSNLSIVFWVNFASLSNNYVNGASNGTQYIIFKQNSQSQCFEGYSISKNSVASGNQLNFVLTKAGTGCTGAVQTSDWSNTTMTAGTWYHVAATFDGQTMSIYVNGQLENTSSHSYPISQSTKPLFIGRTNVSTFDAYFNGTIDNLQVYNRTLSAAEIQNIYNNQSYNLAGAETQYLGYNWTLCATPNNGSADGSQACSSGLLLAPYRSVYLGTSQLVSTVAQGTAPFVISSSAKVTNLNVQYLDDLDSNNYSLDSPSGWTCRAVDTTTTCINAYVCDNYASCNVSTGEVLMWGGCENDVVVEYNEPSAVNTWWCRTCNDAACSTRTTITAATHVRCCK